ncbi:hypothetical protein BP6252_02920 [Coleophoma cylindrospora]|uniref:Alpha/beta hydrolase fold-3 domain-containing protein n=1 Tax=Coleophoma cylindrospora TaxID=1849047 RepID=A0A3D8SG75_9HELO|nr:hypothetical protein BP6252_02920 [Coleophoma cylindrospora]
MSSIPRPPYDPELAPGLAAIKFSPTVTMEMIEYVLEQSAPTSEQALSGRKVVHREEKIAGPQGDITISIISSPPGQSATTKYPGIFYTHGGRMFAGNRFLGIGPILDWVEESDAVCVSVEYRLPPEHLDPAHVEDCYAALLWVYSHLDGLQIDPDKLMIAGSSAGEGLAAGVALLCRDRGGPNLCAQVLICPMLDDRNETVSSNQYISEGSWSRGSNLTGWACLLGSRRGRGRGGEDVSIHAAPSRADDLSGLPATVIDVGSTEILAS